MEQGKELRVAVLELLIWLMMYDALEERRAKDCVNTMLGEVGFSHRLMENEATNSNFLRRWIRLMMKCM